MESRNAGVVAWAGLIVGVIALILAWSAYNRAGEDLEDQAADVADEAADEVAETADEAEDAIDEAGDDLDAAEDEVIDENL